MAGSQQLAAATRPPAQRLSVPDLGWGAGRQSVVVPLWRRSRLPVWRWPHPSDRGNAAWPRGFVSNQPYNQYSLLRTIEENWGLPYLGNASDSAPGPLIGLSLRPLSLRLCHGWPREHLPGPSTCMLPDPTNAPTRDGESLPIKDSTSRCQYAVRVTAIRADALRIIA